MSGIIVEDDQPMAGGFSAATGQQQQTPNNGGNANNGNNGGNNGGNGTGNAGGPSMGGMGAPMNMLGFVNNFGLYSNTKSVDDYLKAVRVQLAQKLATMPQQSKMEIRELPLPSPAGTYAYVTTNFDGSKSAVVLDFMDSNGGVSYPNFAPESNRLDSAIQTLVSREMNVRVRASIVVTPDMYDRADQMASYIIRAFMYKTSQQFAMSTAKILCGTLTLVVSTNLNDAQNFENQHSPHGTRPRADIGLTISIQTRKKDQMMFSGMMGGDYDILPVMSVLAMVDVAGPVAVNGRANLSMPMIRITDITSIIPHPGFLYMGIELAVEYFAKNGLWKNPFRTYTSGGQNLGPLIFEEDGKTLYRAKNDANTEELIQRYMTPHQLLCVDIAAGRARIPELYDFQRANQSSIMTTAAAFFGIKPPAENMVPKAASHVSTDFIGVYGDPNGNLADSRMLTYLQLAAHGAPDQETRRVLMNYSLSSQERAAKIASLAPTFKSLYLDNIEFIQAGWASWIAGAMNANNIRLTDPSGSFGSTALSSLNGVLTDYGAVQGTVSNFGRGGFSPMNMGSYYG